MRINSKSTRACTLRKYLKLLKCNRSQITILIIFALILVVAIALIFTLVKNRPGVIDIDNPEAYIETCIANNLEKTEKAILEANGYLNLSDNYILYSLNRNSEKVPYLCKTSLFYTPCINQEPMLIEKIKKEIEKVERKNAEVCFSQAIESLKKSGRNVEEGVLNFEINFVGGHIIANMNKKIVIKRGENTQIFEKFSAKIPSPLYSLVDTARNIVNFESALCEFDSVNWMQYYRDISIFKFITSEQSKVYTLTDKKTGKKLSFAIKTCVLPAGI